MEPGQAAPAAGGYGELALTALLVLVVVCALLVIVARYAGRWVGAARGEEGLVKVRARVPLEPRRALYVIEVGGKTLLVGSSEGGIQMLTEVEAGELPPPAEARGGFAALVAQALARRGRGREAEGTSRSRGDAAEVAGASSKGTEAS